MKRMSWDSLPEILSEKKNGTMKYAGGKPIEFECPELGKFLADKFNQGRPFTKKTAASCNMLLDRRLLSEFEKKCNIGIEKYPFNEFRFFENAEVLQNPVDEMVYPKSPELNSICFPDSWEELPPNGMKNMQFLRNVTLPKKLKVIGQSCFENCDRMENIIFPDSLERIAEKAFANCKGITSVVLQKHVKDIETEAFAYCSSLETFTSWSDVLYSIPKDCFFLCSNLKYVDIMHAKMIKRDAFSYATQSLVSINLYSRIALGEWIFGRPPGYPVIPSADDHPIVYVPKDDLPFYHDKPFLNIKPLD